MATSTPPVAATGELELRFSTPKVTPSQFCGNILAFPSLENPCSLPEQIPRQGLLVSKALPLLSLEPGGFKSLLQQFWLRITKLTALTSPPLLGCCVRPVKNYRDWLLFLKSALLGVAFVAISHPELHSERVVRDWKPGLPKPNCPCNSIPVPLCRVGQGEGSDRLNGKLIIIIITGPVHNTHSK